MMRGFYPFSSNSWLSANLEQPQESGRAPAKRANFHISPGEETIVNLSTQKAEVGK